MQDTFTGYVPKVGDRVRISPDVKFSQHTNRLTGTVADVAPALSSCFVKLDDENDLTETYRSFGYPGVRFFPGEVALIDTSDLRGKS